MSAPWTKTYTRKGPAYSTEISNRPTHCPVCLQGFQKHKVVKRWDREGELVAHEWMCEGHQVVVYND